jgi:hypothetical protein
MRAASLLRSPPPPGLAPTPAMIREYCGRYQLQIGVIATVSQKGNGLVIEIDGGPQYALNEESHDLFVLGNTGIVVIFTRDTQGRSTGLTINESAEQWPATKLD